MADLSTRPATAAGAGARGRVALIAVALLTALAACGDAGATAPAERLRVGLNADANDTVAGEAGVRHVRQNLSWAAVQPRSAAWDWRLADFRVHAAASRGLTLLPVLLGGAAWAGGWNQLPPHRGAYARWVGRVAARYGPEGAFWRLHPQLPYRPLRHLELWNEPYLEFFSSGGVDPGAYARLVRAAVRRGRRANPAVKYLLQADWTPGEPRRSFIDGMYAAVPDLNEYFDVVAVHPYSGDEPPDRRERYPWGFQRLHEVRKRFVAHGAAGKPLWVTEVGWSTCPAGPRRNCVTERRQSAYMRRVHELLVNEHPYVRALYYYAGRDAPRGRPGDREAWFGIRRRDGSPKPAHEVVRRLARAAG